MTTPGEADRALTVKRDTSASRQQVWDVIADGWTYSQWVVGNSGMRAVEPSWPAPGSKASPEMADPRSSRHSPVRKD